MAVLDTMPHSLFRFLIILRRINDHQILRRTGKIVIFIRAVVKHPTYKIGCILRVAVYNSDILANIRLNHLLILRD